MSSSKFISGGSSRLLGNVLLVAFFIVLIASYSREINLLVDLWFFGGGGGVLGHGVLVLLIAIWLSVYAFNQNPPVARGEKKWINVLSGCVVFASSLVFFLPVEQLRVFVIPFQILGVLGFLGGWPSIKRYLLPVLFLFFALPCWGATQNFLQALTVVVSQSFLKLLGIPVFIEGNFITIPAGIFEVERGCSGVKYFIAGFALSVLTAYLSKLPLGKKILIVAFGVVLSVFANHVRVVVIILLGHFTEMQSPYVRDHEALGWFVFAGVVFPYVFLINYYLVPAMQLGFFSALRRMISASSSQSVPSKISVVIAMCLPMLIALYISFKHNEYNYRLAEFEPPEGWVVHDPSRTPRAFPGASYTSEITVTSSREFGVTQAHIDIGFYGKNIGERSLVNSNNSDVNPRGIRVVSAESSDHAGFKYRQRIVQGVDGDFVLTRDSYIVGDWTTSNRIMARLYQAVLSPFDNHIAAIVVFSLPCEQVVCSEADAKLSRELGVYMAGVKRLLGSIKPLD